MAGFHFVSQEKYQRSRRYFVPMDEILGLLNWARQAPEFISVPELPSSLPPDCEVIAVGTDYNPMGFWVIVHHPSFDEVPLGAPSPLFPEPCRFTYRRIATKP